MLYHISIVRRKVKLRGTNPFLTLIERMLIVMMSVIAIVKFHQSQFEVQIRTRIDRGGFLGEHRRGFSSFI